MRKEKLHCKRKLKSKNHSLKMNRKISKKFFKRPADVVAKDLLGKILTRRINGKNHKAKIVETEAYFGEKDPASRASKGKNKISEMMWESPGKILVYNVHMYKMFNVVTDKKEKASAVLIRAIEPLNFQERCSGPGLLTRSLGINKENFHGKDLFEIENIEIKESDENRDFEIQKAYRVGVTKDLPAKYRFYIKGNKYVSRK
ncbi:MAG TPA: DNA-3-methyladenine glycosylase [Candidatus Nanoarchaeia archaeon]|nr:DNA-3-methyladenine glycosylase [Candidatus Nanoarchaeia archaeon]